MIIVNSLIFNILNKENVIFDAYNCGQNLYF